MIDNIEVVRILFLSLAALGVVALAVIWILRRRMLSPEALSRWKDSRPAPLTPDEADGLQVWQRRMRWVAVGTLFYAGAMVGFVSALPPEAVAVRGVAFLLLPAMIIAGLVLQFGTHCPRCGLSLGLQSSLGVPSDCERCGVHLHRSKPARRSADILRPRA